jgi:RNA polymerase sigma-70 factor (ECF subfamily)
MLLFNTPMTVRRPHDQRNASAPAVSRTHSDALLSDETTIELVVKAQAGDREAVEALLQRSLPSLRRWAHGRLPAAARGHQDTADLVQDAALHAIRRLDTFQPRHVGAMQAYLRESVLNRIRDEVRRIGRHPAPSELPEDIEAEQRSSLETVIAEEKYQHYRDGLAALDARDRELIVARIELQWSLTEIAQRFAMPSPDAARMAVKRALTRLTGLMKDGTKK